MSTKEKITHNVKKFGDGNVAVLNSIDQKTGNEYVKIFTKHHDGKTVIVTKYVGYKTVSADTSSILMKDLF